MDQRIAANSNNHGFLRMKERMNWTTDHPLFTLRDVHGHKLNVIHEIISLIFKQNNNMNVHASQCAAENPVITKYKWTVRYDAIWIGIYLQWITNIYKLQCRSTCVWHSPPWNPHILHIIYLAMLCPYGITKRDFKFRGSKEPRWTVST
jgi:hypothetical protein